MSRRLEIPREFLLSASDPWVRSQAGAVLFGESAEDDHRAVLTHPVVKKLVQDCGKWPGDSRSDHRAAKDVLNKLAMLADFGLRHDDPGIRELTERILSHRDREGRILNHVLMPRAASVEWMFDIDGQDPLLVLVALGLGARAEVQNAIAALVETACPDGGWVWPAAPSPLPCRRFEGGCPYPTLKVLRILAADPKTRASRAARGGVELLLQLAESRTKRYGFGWGEQFGRLKYPFIWFDVLHVLEALSPFRQVWSDARFLVLIDGVVEKADSEGRFTPESVWMEWKSLCFGQKREPSPWVTFIVHRILEREPRRVAGASKKLDGNATKRQRGTR